MPDAATPTRRHLLVSIVSSNPETLDSLQVYLGNAGVACRTARAVADLKRAGASIRAAIVFPDDYADADVAALLVQVRRVRPELRLVLVTREPHRYRVLDETPGGALPLVVLPRPSFGWDILDAIRAHVLPRD